MFDADKTRMIGLPYGEKKLWQYYVKPFSSDTRTRIFSPPVFSAAAGGDAVGIS